MDVVDGSGSKNDVYHIPQTQTNSTFITLGQGVKPSHKTQWVFNKTFDIAFQSKLLEYKKTEATDKSKGYTDIKPCIHSIPWEKIYFYLSEGEYNTIVNTFHTAYVESVSIKIFNLGISSESIQSSSNVTIRNVTPNRFLGIWRGFENHGPVQLGSKISPAFLYGSPLHGLSNKSSYGIVDKDKIGAVTEMKVVDNRVTYKRITSSYDTTSGKSIDLGEANIHFPPVSEMATLKVNATKNFGLIYESTYKPVDGLFHNIPTHSYASYASYAFHNNSVIQHKPYDVNIDLNNEREISDATSGSSGYNVKYEDATIDNMFYRSVRANNPVKFDGGFGIGLFPRRTKDDKNVDANVELQIQTEIIIKAEWR